MGLFAGAKQLWHCSTGTVSWHHFWSRNAYTSTILDGVNSFLRLGGSSQILPGSLRKSFRTTWSIVGLELEALKNANSWRRKVTLCVKAAFFSGNPKFFSVVRWWTVVIRREFCEDMMLMERSQVETKGMGQQFELPPIYGPESFLLCHWPMFSRIKKRWARWWELDVAV